MQPIVYYSNALTSGTVSGSNADYGSNPVRRLFDASIGLVYKPASGAVPSGEVQLTTEVGEEVLPDSLVMPKVELASGYRFTLESEDFGGGNNQEHLDFVVSGDDPIVRDVGASTARRVWRMTVSGASGAAPVRVFEAQLASKYVLPRGQVGVRRDRVRQFTRIPIPGGNPFVRREGPLLRRTTYAYALQSGTAALSGMEAFVEAVAGGEFFTITDDRGDTYWAELLGSEVPFDDQAGIFVASLTFQEVAVE